MHLKVSKLKLLKQSYLNEQYDLESRIKKSYPAQIKELESNIGNYKKDIEFLKEYEKEDNVFYGMTINNILYDEKQKAGEML